MARRDGVAETLEAVDFWMAAAASAAVGIAVLGCMFHWGWIMPADEGPGPYRTAGRVHDLRVLLIVLGAVAVLCLVRAVMSWSGLPVYTAVVLAALGGMFALGLYTPHDEAQIVGDGFGDDWYSAKVEGRFSFYNTTGAPVTVCLGLSGDCDSGAPGPARLRSPGLTVPPDHRLTVDTPSRAADFKLTLTGPGLTHRDAILHTYVPDNSSGP